MTLKSKKNLAKFIQYLSLFFLLSPLLFLLGVMIWVLIDLTIKSFGFSWYWLLFIIPAILAAANGWAEETLGRAENVLDGAKNATDEKID